MLFCTDIFISQFAFIELIKQIIIHFMGLTMGYVIQMGWFNLYISEFYYEISVLIRITEKRQNFTRVEYFIFKYLQPFRKQQIK